MAKDGTYPLVPILSLLSTVFVLIPFCERSFRRTLNAGVLVLAIWTITIAVLTGAQAIAWSGTTVNFTPAWCDLSTRLFIATNVSFPACPWLIWRRIRCLPDRNQNSAVNDQPFSFSFHIRRGCLKETFCQKMGKYAFEIIFGFLLPALVAGPLYFIVQSRRFEIVENFGCEPSIYHAGASILLLDSPPVLLPVVGIVLYMPQLIRALFRNRTSQQISIIYPFARRDFAIACALAVIILPLGIMGIAVDTSTPNIPFWPGWAVVHANEAIKSKSAEQWTHHRWDSFGVHSSQWINTIIAVCFLATYGTTSQIRNLCLHQFCGVPKHDGREPKTPQHTTKQSPPADVESQLGSMQYATPTRPSNVYTPSVDSSECPVFNFEETSTSSVELDSYISRCLTISSGFDSSV